MCYSCYEEAGRPTIINEKTKQAAELIEIIYQQDDCGAGGYAHIVVDDWNTSDSDIDFCIDEAVNGEYEISEAGRLACLKCLEYLKGLTEDERYSALAIQSGFIPISS